MLKSQDTSLFFKCFNFIKKFFSSYSGSEWRSPWQPFFSSQNGGARVGGRPGIIFRRSSGFEFGAFNKLFFAFNVLQFR